MTIICLIGRHGSGKSTVGRVCELNGVKHFSIGQLRRLAAARAFPADVPVPLMLQFRKLKSGEAISKELALQMLDYLGQFALVVIDGFPTTITHLEILPAGTMFCYLWVPRNRRQTRLLSRSTSTLRTWVPGGHSIRDHSLPTLLKEIRKRNTLYFLKNDVEGSTAMAEIGKSILLLATSRN